MQEVEDHLVWSWNGNDGSILEKLAYESLVEESGINLKKMVE